MRLRVLGLVVLCLFLMSPPAATGAARNEYEVKAAFLLNFARLVDWPKDFEPTQGAPWVVGLVGDPAVIRTITASLEGKQVDDVDLAVRPVSSPDEIAGCHILFITRDGVEVDAFAKAADGRPILTIGESRNFAETRGIINFVNRDNKLRFEINHEAAQSAGLKISSRLLRLALLVEGN